MLYTLAWKCLAYDYIFKNFCASKLGLNEVIKKFRNRYKLKQIVQNILNSLATFIFPILEIFVTMQTSIFDYVNLRKQKILVKQTGDNGV